MLDTSTLRWRSVILGAVAVIASQNITRALWNLTRVSKLRSSTFGLLFSPVSAIVDFLCSFITSKKHKSSDGAFWDLIGNTPLVRIQCLSDALDIEVLGKAEFLNPGGSVKDRVAKEIILDAESKGILRSNGDRLFEGTSGSTGISLTLGANCRGYGTSIYMPDDQAIEKVESLRVLGADVTQLRHCSIIDPEHYVNVARKAAESLISESEGKQRGFFANQFENIANFQAHFNGTGVEILEQTGGKIDVFVASSGTGGTIAGTSARLKKYNPNIKVILADPPGSALYNKIRYGVLYNPKDAEGHRTRRIFDTIIEGVGINRLTRNFIKGMSHIDYAYTVSDLEAVHMSRYLISHDGLFVGSSSALNCCAVVKAVKDGTIQRGSTVVVILCDSGVRHLSRFYNSDFLDSLSLLPRYISPKSRPIHDDSTASRAAQSLHPPQSVFEFIN